MAEAAIVVGMLIMVEGTLVVVVVVVVVVVTQLGEVVEAVTVIPPVVKFTLATYFLLFLPLP